MSHPLRRADETFADHQAVVAAWLGYVTVDEMNHDHDRLHRALCQWLGVASQSLLCAAGEPHDEALAGIEEDAVLAVQRFMVHARAGVPQ